MADMASAQKAIGKAQSLVSGEMTDKHIFALLAYAEKPGVKEKFDAQFGKGSADRVLSEVKKEAAPGLSLTLTADFEGMQRAFSEAVAAVAKVEDEAKGFSEHVSGRFSDIDAKIGEGAATAQALASGVEAITATVEGITSRLKAADAVAASLRDELATVRQDLTTARADASDAIVGIEEKIGALAQSITDLKAVSDNSTKELAALRDEIRKVADRPLPKPEPAPKAKPLQFRVTQRDINDNIVAIEVI